MNNGIDSDDDVELAEEQLITRNPHRQSTLSPYSSNLSSVLDRLRKLTGWPFSNTVLLLLHVFIFLAPFISIVIVNAYYFHLFSLTTTQSATLVLTTIHNDLHTAAVDGEGGINPTLVKLIPHNASTYHVHGCGTTTETHAKGVCYSVAVPDSSTSSGLQYADCAAIIPVDTLHGPDVHTVLPPPAEVNLYGPLCRPLPQGHPDMRTFNPYTTRCDMPLSVHARNNAQLLSSTTTSSPPLLLHAPPVIPATPSTPSSLPPLPPLLPSEQISRHIFQTNARADFLQPMQYWNMRSWLDKNTDYTYIFYDDVDLLSFIADYTHPLLTAQQLSDIRTAAALLRTYMPMAATADLVRYMIILKYGGVYVDADTACVDSLSDWIDYSQDIFIVQSNMDLQWILIAAPSHPIILDTLLTAVHNVIFPLEAELAISPVYETTGPPVLLGAIERYNDAVSADVTGVMRPIRIVPSDPPDPTDYANQSLTMYGRTFNNFQFSGHLMLKSCEVEYEQRLSEHVPWVYKQRTIIADYFYKRIGMWQIYTWLWFGVVGLVVIWWVAYRSGVFQKTVFSYCTLCVAVLQLGKLSYELPV